MRVAMCTRNSQHPFILQDVFAYPLRARDVGQATVHDRFHQRIATRDHIAYDIQIRLQTDLMRAKSFDQLYALGTQLRAHRRVDIGIAARDFMSCFFCEDGKATHECAADT